MYKDDFKNQYTTIPFAFHKQYSDEKMLYLIAHNHKELEIISLNRGNANFYIDTVKYALKKGDVLIIPPYCIHRAEIYENTYYDCICFNLDILWDKNLKKELESGSLTVDGFLHAHQPCTVTLQQCVSTAIKACKQKAPGWEMDIIGNLSIAFASLERQDFFIYRKPDIKEQYFGKKALNYIDSHFAEPITSKTAADEFYLNNSYFCRLFKKNFESCFSDFLTSYRMEKAKFYLSSSNLSVSDIAMRVGYHNFSYFCKTFKKALGLSPSEYRKNCNQCL